MIKFLLPFALVAVFSCDVMPATPATGEQKKEALNDAKFDQTLIDNLGKYQSLENFLEANLDTIIKYRYSINTVTAVRSNGRQDSTYLRNDDCYLFFQGNDRYNISNVPAYLKKPLDSLFSSLGGSFINSFEICKTRKITITVRSGRGKHGLYIAHELIWNTEVERDYKFEDNKDLLLNGTCIYRIGMNEYHGH